MTRLARAIEQHDLPAVEKIAQSRLDKAFQVLIGTLLSARTQDATTDAASARLFAAAPTPERMAALGAGEIEHLIYPVSFYRNKARHVKATALAILERFGGRVPATMEELLTLPGVGRKTANLVLIPFGSRENICVDTTSTGSPTVRLVRTTPEKPSRRSTAAALRWWPDINLYSSSGGRMSAARCAPGAPAW